MGNVGEGWGLGVALLWLRWVEQEDGRRAERLAGSVVPGSLREHPGLERHPGGGRAVRVVGGGERMGQHDGRADAPVAAHDLVDEFWRLAKRVVAGIKELDRRAKNAGGAGRLVLPHRLDLVELLSLPPGPGGLTSLAAAQAHDSDGPSPRGGQGHAAPASPSPTPPHTTHPPDT